jgi:hypothetical protein
MDLPAETQLRWILSNTATLLELGAEPVQGLILPTGEFFPDRFDGSPKGVAALMTRVLAHAGLTDLKVELTIVTPEGESESVNCASGSCCSSGKAQLDARMNRVTRRDDGSYVVMVSSGEIKSPVALTTGLVRAVAYMFMTEADGYTRVPAPEREPLTDLAAVMLGFGVLMANGAYMYHKGCGGVQVQSATKMPVDEICTALGVFCRLFDVPERTGQKHLEITPAEHFDEGYAWASSNASVLKLLRKNPDAVRASEYALSPSRSWLARVLGVGAKKRPRSADEELDELERSVRAAAANSATKKALDPAKAKRLAEFKALVDESLEE